MHTQSGNWPRLRGRAGRGECHVFLGLRGEQTPKQIPHATKSQKPKAKSQSKPMQINQPKPKEISPLPAPAPASRMFLGKRHGLSQRERGGSARSCTAGLARRSGGKGLHRRKLFGLLCVELLLRDCARVQQPLEFQDRCCRVCCWCTGGAAWRDPRLELPGAADLMPLICSFSLPSCGAFHCVEQHWGCRCSHLEQRQRQCQCQLQWQKKPMRWALAG